MNRLLVPYMQEAVHLMERGKGVIWSHLHKLRASVLTSHVPAAFCVAVNYGL